MDSLTKRAEPADSQPIDIGTRKQLFVDDYIIASMDSVYRILNQPVKYEGNPIIQLKPAQSVGGNELVIVSGDVIYDEQEQLFKMWYEGASYYWTHNVVAYAYSRDGINWELPNLGLFEYQGSKNNNIVFHRGGGNITPGVFKDPVAKDPQSKYKMIYNSGKGVGVAFSPDGIQWTPVPDKKVARVSDSPHSVLWDPQLGKYVAHTRHNVREVIKNKDTTAWRQVLQSESDDFLKWSTYGVIMKSDEKDPPHNRQFYNMEWMPYEGVYFGFISVYHVPGPGPWWDKVDIQLTFSRDGRTWHRAGDRQVFVPNGPDPGDFDWAMIYVMQHPIVIGDEIWIYYAGFSGLHWAIKRGELQGGAVGLAKLRLDGFISIDPGGSGTLTTKLLTTSGDCLIVNANARYGLVRVEVLDADGKPIEGFSKDDADPITDDSIRHTVTWNGSSDVKSLKGKTFALKFYLERGKLYSFVFRAGQAESGK